MLAQLLTAVLVFGNQDKMPLAVVQAGEGHRAERQRSHDLIHVFGVGPPHEVLGKLRHVVGAVGAVDCCGGPEAGKHNFYRGGDLKIYHQETLDALKNLDNCLPGKQLRRIWDNCISEVYIGKSVWVHGDVTPGNILLQNNKFYGMIDFGILGTGDPACDYAMAWTYFDDESRKIF